MSIYVWAQNDLHGGGHAKKKPGTRKCVDVKGRASQWLYSEKRQF